MTDTRGMLRASLWPFSLAFGAVAWLRGRAYDAGWLRAERLGVRVVAVGNLGVGGNGKTPLVAWLVARALQLGRRPGVLARGYGREPGATLNDEGRLLARRFPGLPQEQAPDRVAAGRRLLARHTVDVLFLDDGFQHRRLARDLDLVCLDAERPFAQGRLLPAGDLREPPSALTRADAVVMTRAGALDEATRRQRIATIHGHARRELPVWFAEHAPLDVESSSDRRCEPVATLRGREVVLLSSIARPAAFEATVVGLGARVLAHHARRDHHRHDPAAVEALARDARRRGAGLLTTEKDAVKLDAVVEPYLVLRIGLRFLGAEPEPSLVGLS